MSLSPGPDALITNHLVFPLKTSLLIFPSEPSVLHSICSGFVYFCLCFACVVWLSFPRVMKHVLFVRILFVHCAAVRVNKVELYGTDCTVVIPNVGD